MENKSKKKHGKKVKKSKELEKKYNIDLNDTSRDDNIGYTYIKSFFYSKNVRFSLYGIVLVAIVLAYVLFKIPLFTIPISLFIDFIFTAIYETNAWQYNSRLEMLKCEDENYIKELRKYVTVYSITDRRILGIKFGQKIEFKNVLKKEYKKQKREESNKYLVSDLEKNMKRDFGEIEAEKRNYMSLLELVDKYKKLESKVHKKSYESIPTVDYREENNIGGYTYMKK